MAKPTKLSGIALIMMFCLIVSCSQDYRKAIYFNDLLDSVGKELLLKKGNLYNDPRIQAGDLLQVTVNTIDPKVTAPIENSTSPASNDNALSGFIVNRNGEIELPIIGAVKLSGLTTVEAKHLLTAKASEYYHSPIVNVRIMNFKVTVLGEVNEPGQYIIPDEHANVIDAIGLAGDLNIYGRRDNVLLIRSLDSARQYIRLNLNSSSIFSSPYFYLKQGDVLYVESLPAKVRTSDVAKLRTYTLIVSAVSVAVLLLNVFIRR